MIAAPSFRHTRLDRPSWWRCLVRGLEGAVRWGTVTGAIELGEIVTTYEVRLHDGARLHAWPSTVEPAPATGPGLRVVDGGRR